MALVFGIAFASDIVLSEEILGRENESLLAMQTAHLRAVSFSFLFLSEDYFCVAWACYVSLQLYCARYTLA